MSLMIRSSSKRRNKWEPSSRDFQIMRFRVMSISSQRSGRKCARRDGVKALLPLNADQPAGGSKECSRFMADSADLQAARAGTTADSTPRFSEGRWKASGANASDVRPVDPHALEVSLFRG